MTGLRAMIQGASWSGKERNHLFVNLAGEQFEDLSALSGIDHVADGRVFAMLDMDRDGFADFAVLNTNAPRFLLFRNGIGDFQARAGARTGFVALRFQGGNRSALASDTWSARDGYGALVSVSVGGAELKREQRCGEGLSAQNSSTMIVGIGSLEAADAVHVRWPSGREQTLRGVASGSLLTVYENSSHSPTGEAFVVVPYARIESREPASARGAPAAEHLALATPAPAGEQPPLTLYTTTATWCAACKSRLPQLARLRAAFSGTELSMWGVPYDEKETAEQLDAYRAKYAPAYELLRDVSPTERTLVKQVVDRSLGGDALPASIVTDAEGKVLLATWGVPSLSQMRELSRAGGTPAPEDAR